MVARVTLIESQFLNLIKADDKWEAPKKIHCVVRALFDTATQPPDAARAIDRIIQEDTQDAHLAYLSADKPTAEQLRNGDIRYPAPSDLLHWLFNCMGTAAMELTPHHKAQVYMVETLKELQNLPKTKLPDATGDELDEIELYNINPDNGYGGFAQWLWDLNQSICRPPSRDMKVEEGNYKIAEYLNYSAFLARLLEAGVVEVTNLSALITGPFADSNKEFGANSFDPIAAAMEFDGHIIAAAQWILWGHQALYEMTENNVRVKPMEKLFTRNLWDGWKEKFEAVDKDERFHKECRFHAWDAHCKMHKQEGKEVPKFIIEKLGFIVEEVSDDEEDEDDDGEGEGDGEGEKDGEELGLDVFKGDDDVNK